MGSDSDRDAYMSLVTDQKLYYDLRAPDFGDEARPDRKVPGLIPDDVVGALVEDFAPEGDVLEVACGYGSFTRHLARHAATVTALDASPAMLARAKEHVAAANVTYVQADVFSWSPDRQYDAVFFANWLSHVPPPLFEAFWDLVRQCLVPGGRAGFVDEDDRARGYDDCLVVDGVPAARRTLGDGRQFDIVKVFWAPDELERALRALRWHVTIRRFGDGLMLGTATYAGD